MDIQQPPRGAALDSPEMQRFLQDTYNAVKTPCCKVYHSGNVSFTTGFVIDSFDSVEFNQLGPWDLVNHRFRPQVPGYYHYHYRIHFQMFAASAAGSPVYAMVALVNSAGAVAHCTDRYYVPSGTGLYNIYTLNCHGIVYLNGMNDYLDCRSANGMTTAPADITKLGGKEYTAFVCHKITY